MPPLPEVDTAARMTSFPGSSEGTGRGRADVPVDAVRGGLPAAKAAGGAVSITASAGQRPATLPPPSVRSRRAALRTFHPRPRLVRARWSRPALGGAPPGCASTWWTRHRASAHVAPGQQPPGSDDTRELGVKIDRIKVEKQALPDRMPASMPECSIAVGPAPRDPRQFHLQQRENVGPRSAAPSMAMGDDARVGGRRRQPDGPPPRSGRRWPPSRARSTCSSAARRAGGARPSSPPSRKGWPTPAGTTTFSRWTRTSPITRGRSGSSCAPSRRTTW